jgi:hypothetical protein
MLKNNQLRAKKWKRKKWKKEKQKKEGTMASLLQKCDGNNCLTAKKIYLTTSDFVL